MSNSKHKNFQSWKDKKKVKNSNISPKKRNSNYFSKNKYNKNKFNQKKIIKKLIKIVISLFLLFAILISIFVIITSRNLPNPDELLKREISQSTKIYDRTGEHVLYEISGDEKRTLVSIDDIPDHVEHAVVAIEDKNFYEHKGFSIFAMFRTAITNVIYNRTAGGSTLTQQFVKNAVLTPEKTIIRKVKELIISYRLEKKFNKDEILQMYLNEIPYGSNAYGVEAASQKYFGKSVRDVSIAEAAVLASIVQAPTKYSPYGPNKDILLGRKDYVIELMNEQGYITDEEMKNALNEELLFEERNINITAPHFVLEVKHDLAQKYGEKTIEQGGLKIITTLDLYKQEIAEEVIEEKLNEYGERYNASNASLVAIDPKTGQVLALVGSRDYFNDDIDGQVNVATRLRQPGSSMKPLVYATLFEKGYKPETILYDVNTNFSNNPDNPYEPKNYNLSEHGPISIRKALAGSLNIPAVKALYLAGVDETINYLETFGYSSFTDKDRFGLSFVLGGAEVKLIEHTNAYSAFARDGEIREISMILKVEDNEGNILEEWKEHKKSVLSKESARMINSILSDNEARSFTFGQNNKLHLKDRPVAAKTGTTNDYKDAWTIGYTPSIVAGVWVGNSNNDEMNNAGGSTVAAPIWHDFMAKILKDTPVEEFKKPEIKETGIDIIDGNIPVTKVRIDKTTGQIANEYTSPNLIEYKEIINHHSILHYIDKDNPLKGKIENPENDPQYKLWEKAIKDWVKRTSSSTEEFTIPENNPEFGKEENIPELKINFPSEGENVKNNYLPTSIETKANHGINSIAYIVNGNLFSLDKEINLNNSISLKNLPNGYHTLTIRVCDKYKNCTDKSVNFNLAIKNNNISNNKNSVSFLFPSSGLIVSEFDLPLSAQINISIPNRVYRLDILNINENGEKKYLSSFNSNINNLMNISINDLNKGVNKIYAQLIDYNGDIISSKELIISLN
jgi:1A family penicillin-binding protein